MNKKCLLVKYRERIAQIVFEFCVAIHCNAEKVHQDNEITVKKDINSLNLIQFIGFPITFILFCTFFLTSFLF